MMRAPCPLRRNKRAEEKDGASANRCPDHGGENAQPCALLLGLRATNARRLSRQAVGHPPMGELLLHPGGAAVPAAKGSATGLSTEVKQAIAVQVKQEIAAEQAAAKGGDQKPASGEQVPAALDPKIRYFVVSSDLDATTSDGVECQLTPGDVVYRTGDTPDDDHMVDATVKSSKKDNCAVGVSVGVETGDLQEMHNQLRIQMDAGLKTLAEKQGKDGIPAAPDTKTQAGEVPPPAPDTNVANDLQDQKKEADQAEAEAQQPN